MTNETISLFIIAAALMVIGFIACRYYQWKSTKGYIPLFLGLFLLYMGTLGPLSHSKEKMSSLTHLEDNQERTSHQK